MNFSLHLLFTCLFYPHGRRRVCSELSAVPHLWMLPFPFSISADEGWCYELVTYIWSDFTASQSHAPFIPWFRACSGGLACCALTEKPSRRSHSRCPVILNTMTRFLTQTFMEIADHRCFFCKLGQKLGRDASLKTTWCKHIFVSLLAGLSSGRPSCWGTFLVFNFCMGHKKFSGIMCIHVCYLIGADSVLTLWFILLHHQCWDSQRWSDCVCCLCLCMTLEAFDVQIEWRWDVHRKWVVFFFLLFFKLYPLLHK